MGRGIDKTILAICCLLLKLANDTSRFIIIFLLSFKCFNKK